MNIYVGNLAKEVSENDLQGLFSEFGLVKSAKVIKDIFSGDSKGFGFVEMPGLSEAQKAISALNTKDVKGKKLIVNEARPKSDGSNRNGRGGKGVGAFRSGGSKRW